MNPEALVYHKRRHSARNTDEYLFNQLVPYLGNKRRLLHLILEALEITGTLNSKKKNPPIFADFFAGSGVVSRLARQNGYRVIANDWEPYSHALNHAILACVDAPEHVANPDTFTEVRFHTFGTQQLQDVPTCFAVEVAGVLFGFVVVEERLSLVAEDGCHLFEGLCEGRRSVTVEVAQDSGCRVFARAGTAGDTDQVHVFALYCSCYELRPSRGAQNRTRKL